METNLNGGAPPVAALTEARTAERERVNYINEMCGKLHLPDSLKRE